MIQFKFFAKFNFGKFRGKFAKIDRLKLHSVTPLNSPEPHYFLDYFDERSESVGSPYAHQNHQKDSMVPRMRLSVIRKYENSR